MANRKFGWKGGQVYALNIQTGVATLAANGSGYGEKAVTFNNSFKNTPTVICTSQEIDTAGILSVTTSNTAGFTVHLQSSAITSDNVSVGWIAIDQTK